MAWFQRVVFSDEKLLIWRAMAFWKAELFSFQTSHRSTKSHKIFNLFWGRFGRSTQNGRIYAPLAGILLTPYPDYVADGLVVWGYIKGA